MRKRCLLLALALACVLPLCACAESLSALEALVPGATGLLEYIAGQLNL